MKKTNTTIISLAQVRDILSKLDLEDADQIQKRTFDYVKNFPECDYKTIDKAAKELASSDYVTLEQAYEILNVNPQTIPELRVFTSAWKKLIPTEELDKILSITQNAYA
ncbi:MAG TPA: RNA polymerase Rpb4 [Nitrososphaerales archaeon]|jgi:DNA-directed RNA polymerase subunit F|nr:RNA polymerase Rpb4 [Nitrososphaerota archaeon]HIC84368.1 RNA polymerase Rpb4 [Nitrososphaerales archaeon]HIM82848.1 RNA polymerase Rpb4 [Nitrososphaerales archaeon]|tara:strand:+ start:49 stop:375 length:327 start_codon:yes stop_codon:yes gene_type:complete